MLKKTSYIMVLILLLVSKSAVSEELLFLCGTTNNKNAKIIRSNEILTYSYGTTGKTELKLIRHRSDIRVRLGQGSPGTFYDSITFRNGDYEYTVNASSTINNIDVNNFADIDVFKKIKKLLR